MKGYEDEYTVLIAYKILKNNKHQHPAHFIPVIVLIGNRCRI